jgi:hypothetical protein
VALGDIEEKRGIRLEVVGFLEFLDGRAVFAQLVVGAPLLVVSLGRCRGVFASLGPSVCGAAGAAKTDNESGYQDSTEGAHQTPCCARCVSQQQIIVAFMRCKCNMARI